MGFSYDEAIAALGDALVYGTNPSLEAITAMAEDLGRPQDSFATIQITGTNGKTSTARLVAAIVAAHGHPTGLYTSPELERYPERVELDGAPVSDAQFARAIEVALGVQHAGRPGNERATEFELLTAGALWLFRERQIDFAVLEVGLGGRWDATSVTDPAVAVITGVGLDHTALLGETREEIATEKAAIIRPACAPVLGPGTVGVEEVFLEHAERAATHARVVRPVDSASPVAEDMTVRYSIAAVPDRVTGVTVVDVQGLHGEYPGLELCAPSYQAPNVATAVAAAEAALGKALDADAIQRALDTVRIPGRFELVNDEPPIVVDAAHNPQAAQVLAGAITEAFGSAQRPALLLSVFSDKDVRGIVSALAPVVCDIACTRSRSARALPADALASIVREVTGVEPRIYQTTAHALDDMAAPGQGPLVVTGSISTAGEVRGLLRRR